MTGPDQDAAREKLEALRRAFTGRLRERIEELRQAVDAACRGEASAEQVESLAHKLSGTAGSYGFVEVGEIAADLEALCERGFQPDHARALVDRLLSAMP